MLEWKAENFNANLLAELKDLHLCLCLVLGRINPQRHVLHRRIDSW